MTGGIISCVRNVYNLEATWLAVRISILEVHNSSLGFLYVSMENRHYKTRHDLILLVQYAGPARGTP